MMKYKKTMTVIVYIALFAVVITLILVKVLTKPVDEQHPPKMPTFRFLNLQHEPLTIDTVACAHSIVIFYSPGCDFCEHEGAELSRNAAQFAHCNLFFITVEPADSAKAYTERHQLLSHSGYYSLVDTTRMSVMEFGIRTIPTTFIYDHDKNLVEVFEGEINAKRLVKLITEGK